MFGASRLAWRLLNTGLEIQRGFGRQLSAVSPKNVEVSSRLINLSEQHHRAGSVEFFCRSCPQPQHCTPMTRANSLNLATRSSSVLKTKTSSMYASCWLSFRTGLAAKGNSPKTNEIAQEITTENRTS
jgi:hypothetical protein